MRGSSPRTRRVGVKTVKRSVKCAVFSLKFAACDEVASAMWTGLLEVMVVACERSERSWTAPGNGAEEGNMAA